MKERLKAGITESHLKAIDIFVAFEAVGTPDGKITPVVTLAVGCGVASVNV